MTELKKNNEITFEKVLLIDESGSQIGVITTSEANKIARSKGLDVVCVAPTAKVPVCKIMDYGKYKYDTLRKEKESKKNQKTQEMQEIQLSYVIQEHDLQTKANVCKKIIAKGNTVRVVLRLKGREVTFMDAAKAKVERFIELCSEFTSIRKDIFVEGRDIKAVLEKKKGE